MKIIFVPLGVFGFLIGLILLLDVLIGLSLKTALNHVLNPFLVMDTAEVIIFAGLFLAIGIQYYVHVFVHKGKDKTEKSPE